MTCDRCSDTGMRLTDARFAIRCDCPAGQRLAGVFYAPSDKKKRRPFYIPGSYPPVEQPKRTGRERATGEKEE